MDNNKLHNLKDFCVDEPYSWYVFPRNREEESNRNITYLDKEVGKYFFELLDCLEIFKGEPFLDKSLFNEDNKLAPHYSNREEIQYWLTSLEVISNNEVIMITGDDIEPQAALLTWGDILDSFNDMVSFYLEDFVIFDQSLDWFLYYFHHVEFQYSAGRKFTLESKKEGLADLKAKYPEVQFINQN